MKPNKQKIFSSQPTKPGSATKLQILSTLTKSASDSTKANPSEFKLSSIATNLNIKKSSTPFKLLNFSYSVIPKDKQVKINENGEKINSVLTRYSNASSNNGRVKRLKGFSSEYKDDEVCNNTNDTVKYRGDSIDEYFGIFPNKYWCEKCRCEVDSKVKMNLPTLSV